MASEFEMVRGSTISLTVVLVNETGTPVDITGYQSVTLYADKQLNATSPTITKTATSVTPSAGRATFLFIPANTSSLATGDYYAEVKAIITTDTVEYITNQPFVFRIKQRVKL